jgi:hypothetical protein
MSAISETIFDPADLAFHFDRLTWAALPREEQDRWQELSDWIYRQEPEDPEAHSSCASKDELNDAREELGEKVALIEQLADKIGVEDPDELDEDAIEDALQKARAEGEKDATVPSRANTAERKAMRLVIERRLRIVRREDRGDLVGLIVAECRGDSGSYTLGYDPRSRQYRCTCQARGDSCSHIGALKLVT